MTIGYFRNKQPETIIRERHFHNKITQSNPKSRKRWLRRSRRSRSFMDAVFHGRLMRQKQGGEMISGFNPEFRELERGFQSFFPENIALLDRHSVQIPVLLSRLQTPGVVLIRLLK